MHKCNIHIPCIEHHVFPSTEQNRTRGSIGDMGQIPIWGLMVSVSRFFTLSSKLWKGQKLRRINLLHRKLVTLDFHFPQTQHVFVLMIFAPSGNFHDPQNQLFLIVDPPNYLKSSKQSPK